MEWESRFTAKSKLRAGVEFVIARMSFSRRIELMRSVRDLASRVSFFSAGRDEKEQMEASLLGAEIDRLYLEWGLKEIRGLAIDGESADVGSFLESGPEELVLEAIGLIRNECGLTEQERKN